MEEILELGPESFGLLNRSTGVTRSTAVALFNAGNVHRTGPFRLATRLARVLGSAGYPVFRFDLPGVGDTLSAANRPLVQVTGEVLDRIQERTGCTHFVVGGICAGADRGWHLALSDPRVSGVLLLDGLARRGGWFQLARLCRAVHKTPSAWWATLQRLARRPGNLSVSEEELRDWPKRGSERAQMRTLLTRGIKIFALYTGGTAYFLHPRQFRSTFGKPASDRAVTFAYWPETDHLFYAEPHRQRLIAALKTWIESQFPGNL